MAVRPFTDTLREMRSGITHDELSAKMQQVVEAVRRTGKPGELVLKISVKPFSKGNTDTLNISDDIKVKVPELDRGGTVFFATVENNLSRRDPNQADLFDIKEVVYQAPRAVVHVDTEQPQQFKEVV